MAIWFNLYLGAWVFVVDFDDEDEDDDDEEDDTALVEVFDESKINA